MAQSYTVSLEKIIKNNSYEVLYTPSAASDIYISSKDVNRPGLMLTGNDEFFDPKRVEFLGLSEFGYLNSVEPVEREISLARLFSASPACVIITRGLEPMTELLPLAQKYRVPVLRSNDSTSGSMSTLISYLGVELAERITGPLTPKCVKSISPSSL